MLERISAACTGPRVALLALLAIVNMLVLILHAELPMVGAMQVAVALQKADPTRPLPQHCDAANMVGSPDSIAAFDGRKSGYRVVEVQAILCAMEANGGQGKQFYLERHFPIDMVFPLLYGPAMAALYLFLLRQYTWPPRALMYLALVPLVAAALDIAENLSVRSLVVGGLPASERLVTLSSALTVAKYALVQSSAIVTLVFLSCYLLAQSVQRTSPRV